MIRQLQKRFIRISVISLTMAMVLVVGIVNVANWISVRNELFGTLNLLNENESEMEIVAETEERRDLPAPEEEIKSPFPGPSRHFRNMMAESNWFSAMVSETGAVERVMLARIENLEEETARELIGQILADGRITLGEFRSFAKKHDVDISLADLPKYVKQARELGFIK